MNYCTKCGKEIPEGENKLCDECKKSLLTDMESEEKEAVKEEKFKISKDKKEKKEKKNIKINKKLCAIIVLVIVLLAVVLFECTTKTFSNMIFGKNKVGITVGNNNNNFGYANAQGDWIYYMCLSEDASNIEINKIKKDGTGKELLARKDWEIFSMNVYGNYLYFIAYEAVEDENTYVNNKIYKMSLDGKELRVINDNNFSDDGQTIYVTNNRVFYIGENYNIYSMDLEGGDRKLVSDNGTGYIGITDKYILYNAYPENPESETDYVTYIMNIDGTNSKNVNGQRLYNPNIVGDQIYYVNGDNSEVHRIDVNGENDTLIYKSPAYNMNVSGDYIYYINYKNENDDSEEASVCIHRINLDGTDHKIICEMVNYSSFIDVVGDWIYYTDHDDNSYFINLIKTDGSDTINLFKFGFTQQDYENLEEMVEDTSVEAEEE